MATVKVGTYVFNEVLTALPTSLLQEGLYTYSIKFDFATGFDWTGGGWHGCEAMGYGLEAENALTYMDAVTHSGQSVYNFATNTWVHEEHRTITIVTNQTLSNLDGDYTDTQLQDFADWFTSNTVKQPLTSETWVLNDNIDWTKISPTRNLFTMGVGYYPLTANNTYDEMTLGVFKFLLEDVDASGQSIRYGFTTEVTAGDYNGEIFYHDNTWHYVSSAGTEYTATDTTKLRTLVFYTPVTGGLLTWLQANAVKQYTYKFKHYYRNEKLVGTGSYKFRRYSTINYKLRAPVLSLSGDKLSIVAVDSINEYAKDFKLSAVKTSGGTTTNVIVAKTVDTYNLPGDLIADDATGSYYITAILEANEPYVDSNESNKLTYTLKARLATPTNVTSSMTTITWNSVANAGSYKVYMDNVLYQDNAGTANEVNYVFNDTLSSDTNTDSTAFTCGGKSYAKMIYTYASSSSNALLYYDSNNVATTVYSNGSWVSGTYKYLKFVTKPSGRWFATNGTFATSTYSYDISTNSLWGKAIDGVHSFTVVATGNSSYRDSLQSDAVLITKSSLTQLSTPQNVSIDGTTLSWDEVENATSYDIYADGTLIGNTTGEAGETWVLNKTVTISKNQYFNIEFKSNNTKYNAITIKYAIGKSQISYDDTVTYLFISPFGYKWDNDAYRTITFETAPTGDLLTWLQANGTKQ